jgi:hypothetical protein
VLLPGDIGATQLTRIPVGASKFDRKMVRLAMAPLNLLRSVLETIARIEEAVSNAWLGHRLIHESVGGNHCRAVCLCSRCQGIIEGNRWCRRCGLQSCQN